MFCQNCTVYSCSPKFKLLMQNKFYRSDRKISWFWFLHAEVNRDEGGAHLVVLMLIHLSSGQTYHFIKSGILLTANANLTMARSLLPSFSNMSTRGTVNSPFSKLVLPGTRSRK